MLRDHGASRRTLNSSALVVAAEDPFRSQLSISEAMASSPSKEVQARQEEVEVEQAAVSS